MPVVLDLVTAEAATQLVRDNIDINFTGVPPLGEMATHRSPNKTNKEAALDALRASETDED